MSRNIYLNMKTLKEAKEILLKDCFFKSMLKKEEIEVFDSVGRVLSEPVTAKISSPNFHAAAMDGIAVKASSTFGAYPQNPKELTINKDAFYVNTGHVMPEGTDAVIMIENVNEIGVNRVEIDAPVFPWQYVRKVGEDIVATELLFPHNHTITPYCVGALLSGGIFKVMVKEKPKVLIIPTGSELVDPKKLEQPSNLKKGQVIESNSYVIAKLVETYGGSYVRNDIMKDDAEEIKKVVKRAADSYNMILIIGGSSAGSEDYAKAVIESLGEILVHGVTIMPGKPVVMGKINNIPVFGVPGYPVSAIIAFENFIGPMICKMLGTIEPEREKVQVEPTRKISSKLGIEEFLRVKLGLVGNRIVATPLPRGAGNITTITEADGIIKIPNNVEGLKDFEPVEAELLKPLSSIKNTIVVVGSHDNTIDVLEDEIRGAIGHITVSSSNVGSMGGLMAIKRGVCHVAGSHLLDESDGSYNISYIKKHLPDIKVKVVNLVLRDQGLIIPKGNPKGIRGIEDLSRKDITFINRQVGSGTRILLDYKLKELKINPSTINGYPNEEVTHMSVAVAVLSGTANVGLGIFAAAKALNLDFIPVVTEQYDLVIPERYFETENIKALLDVINTGKFKKRVEELGGYHTNKTGQIMM
ncbi:MAG: molybdopterin biosynthesis protein [Desulfobacterales bacterium]|nr:molybdopterin biosynthesis protein [Desulfobacterales bacterium]MBF0395491.1 molybdopterin biosynthesis protein [Desulfobacterales bacterium]